MPRFEDFKRKHMLNPNRHKGYEKWTNPEKNAFLRDRLGCSNGKGGYGRKNRNSVIIATSEEILEDFRNPIYQDSKPGFYWSANKYPIWVFQKRKKDGHGQVASSSSSGIMTDDKYSVMDLKSCKGLMHVLAKIVPRESAEGFKPVHYSDQNITPTRSEE